MVYFRRVSVIGLGYIGLPMAGMIAMTGSQVIGVDINQEIVDRINLGKINLAEDTVKTLISQAVQSGKLRAVTQVEPADVFLIAVPTPIRADFKPNISAIENVVESIGKVLKKGNLIILESTSPIGTIEHISSTLADRRPDLNFPQMRQDNPDINIAYCPERILPGNTIHELIHNDKVIGGMTKNCSKRAITFYQTFVRGACLATEVRVAELCKLAENAFRDVNLAFANELSLICEHLNIDVWELIALANKHPRVNILQPSVGVGGHCIPVDPWFIVDSCPQYSALIRQARKLNEFKTEYVINTINNILKNYTSPIVCCLGLAYKPGTDDIRNSPALKVIEHVAKACKQPIIVHDPYFEHLPDALTGKNIVFMTLKEAIEQADIVIMLTKHQQYIKLDQELCHLISQKRVVDFLNIRELWQNDSLERVDV